MVAEPTIIVKAMSPKSEADDTGRKWQTFILLSQDQRVVNVHSGAISGASVS